jgi:hypothetical protein
MSAIPPDERGALKLDPMFDAFMHGASRWRFSELVAALIFLATSKWNRATLMTLALALAFGLVPEYNVLLWVIKFYDLVYLCGRGWTQPTWTNGLIWYRLVRKVG